MKSSICLYCGVSLRGNETDEHVIAEAIGGTLTIPIVCRECNNGVLSRLDKELISNSPLAIIAASELNKALDLIFDVDHDSDELIMDAVGSPGAKAPAIRPQIIFEPTGFIVRGDSEEVELHGHEAFARALLRAVKSAFDSSSSVTSANRRRLVHRRLPAFPSPYRYPPRVVAMRPVADFSPKMKLEFRYVTANDGELAIRQLRQLDAETGLKPLGYATGSNRPIVRNLYNCALVLRALTKIGLNLLERVNHLVSKNRDAFRDARSFVLSGSEHPFNLIQNGFVQNVELASLDCPDRCHKFRLTFGAKESAWRLVASFFGGKVGATVCFPGAAPSGWVTVDITAPLNSHKWTIRRSPIVQPVLLSLELRDVTKIVPSAGIINPQVRLAEQLLSALQ